MKTCTSFLIMALLASVLRIGCLRAAEEPPPPDFPPLNPVQQPLAIARAATAAVLQTLLATRQARAFKLDEKDFAGKLPGVGARIESLRAFLDRLAGAGGKNIWYGVAQRGSSIAGRTGAMGWDWEAGDGDARARLLRMGLDAGGLDVQTRRIGAGEERIVISRDAETRKELFGGGDSPQDSGWRNGLAAFMNGREDSAGLWVNARPLLGLLTLLTGIDLRAALAARAMAAPAWIRLELSANREDTGFEICLDNILPGDIRNSGAPPVLVRNRGGALFEAHFPAPEGLANALGVDRDVFALANIDISAMTPRSVGVAIRRSDSGAPAWNAMCLMPDRAWFVEQFARVRAWLEALGAAPSPLFGIEEARSRRGDALFRIRAGRLSLVAGVVAIDAPDAAGAGSENALLVLSPTAESWPDPEDLAVGAGEAPCVAEWRISPDPAARGELVRALAAFFRRKGTGGFSERFFDEFLPDAGCGRIVLENGGLVMRFARVLPPASGAE